MKKLVYIILILQTRVMGVAGQDVPAITEQHLENSQPEPGEADDALLQQLAYLRSHPLSINEAEAGELSQLPWLTDLQIQHLLIYRRLIGPLVSLYELQAVPHWDLITIRRTIPYIILEGPGEISRRLKSRFYNGSHSLLARLSRTWETGINSKKQEYPGSPEGILFRYGYRKGRVLQYGLTAEKDPGERLAVQRSYTGFDFYSFHLFMREAGLVKAFALGDYLVNLGQGLIQWQSFGFRKSAAALSVKRQSPVLVPYQSTGEMKFQRGAAITAGKGPVAISLFFFCKGIPPNTMVTL